MSVLIVASAKSLVGDMVKITADWEDWFGRRQGKLTRM